MKRTWTIIGVRDVSSSLKWYQSLFGQAATPPAHNYCAHEHPSLMSPDHGTPGNGLLLFFRVDDFDLALQGARSFVTRLEEEPHVNPNTQTKEFSQSDGRADNFRLSLFGRVQRLLCCHRQTSRLGDPDEIPQMS